MNWAFQIKTIVSEIGMGELWSHRKSFNLTSYIPLIKQRLLDIYKQSWYSSINNSRRLHYYSKYKHEFELETYLKHISNKIHKISFTRFRLSSHDLAIETGRYNSIELEDRKCNQCNMNTIESEFHFLLICPKYTDLRKKMLKPYYNRWPTLMKFEQIMSTTNIKEIRNLAQYVYDAFKIRSNN